MAIENKIGVYNKQKFTIPKNDVYTIQFNGTNPNYFRVNNMGETTLYFATDSIPREDLYDFKCSPNSLANYAEPKTRDFLYCYNPNNVDVDIIVTYWDGDFDPAFIAFGETTLSIDGTVKTDGIINAFNTPLPTGDNMIGRVDGAGSMASVLSDFKVNYPKYRTDVISSLSSLLDALCGGANGVDNNTIKSLLEQILAKTGTGGSGGGGTNASVISNLEWIKGWIDGNPDYNDGWGTGGLSKVLSEINGNSGSYEQHLANCVMSLQMIESILTDPNGPLLQAIKSGGGSGGSGVGVLVDVPVGQYTAPEGYYVAKVISESYNNSSYEFTLPDGTVLSKNRETFNEYCADFRFTTFKLLNSTNTGNISKVIIKEL